MIRRALKNTDCPICGAGMDRLLDLPKLPLTEMYEPWTEDFEAGRHVADQAFLFCRACSHGQLETVIQPATLYGDGYRTKTAGSGGALSAVRRFADFIKGAVDVWAFDTVVDIGGNDGSLAGLFPVRKYVPVDPNAPYGIRNFIEDADLSPLKSERKLIVSSHTIEHLPNPRLMLEKIVGVLGKGDVVALQFPSLDLLVEDARIDQIHHQHVHYFSLRSIGLLLAKYGLQIVRHQFDHAHYGALMVLCKRGIQSPYPTIVTVDSFNGANYTFGCSMHSFSCALGEDKSLIGFGAGLMLPILAYHLSEYHTELVERCEYIADNDRLKHGLRYVNFNKPIRADYSLEGRDVVITAIATKQTARLLVCEAFQKGARNVFVPLHGL